MTAPITKKEFLTLPVADRVFYIMSDGLWYSIHKLCRIAKAKSVDVYPVLENSIETGFIIQSDTGAKSYRMPLKSMRKWYAEHGFQFGDEVADFLIPARVWCGKTEVEAFEEAPLRNLAIVSFTCSPEEIKEVRKRLECIAYIREAKPNSYRAYCAGGSYVSKIIKSVIKDGSSVRARFDVKRREAVDFPKDYLERFTAFYMGYGQHLSRAADETIRIFLPDYADREAQMVFWVFEALEKYDEKSTVPFSGYFDNVLKHWPYNLPSNELGNELAKFQRQKSKAIKTIRENKGRDYNPDFKEISSVMGVDNIHFLSLEECDRVWKKVRNATSLNWEDDKGRQTERKAKMSLDCGFNNVSQQATNHSLSHCFSLALIDAALETHDYTSPSVVLSQISEREVDYRSLNSLSEEFIESFADKLKQAGVNRE